MFSHLLNLCVPGLFTSYQTARAPEYGVHVRFLPAGF